MTRALYLPVHHNANLPIFKHIHVLLLCYMFAIPRMVCFTNVADFSSWFKRRSVVN
jgi:hypothetical protein